ncbi:MAG: hypothetical protein ACQETQ_09720 [Spirochaetota bacterium]
MRLRYLSLIALIVLISSCATAPVAQRENRIMGLVDRLNGESLVRVMEVTSVPFVLDREILSLERDVETMWSNMREAGFFLLNAEIDEIIPVHEDSYRRFGDTMDMRVFFEKYIPEDATLVRISSDNGDFLFLLGDKFWGVPRMYAMKGPLP